MVIVSPGLHAQGQIGDEELPENPENPVQTQPRGTNYITCASYENITYNGYTIEQINATNGNFGQLWGSPDSVDDHDGWAKTYHYNINTVGYNEEGYMPGMTILSAQWPVKILNKEVRVGDLFSELQQKFGQDLKIIYKPVLGPEYVVSFNCSGNERDGLQIVFNPATHQVVEIKYYVNP